MQGRDVGESHERLDARTGCDGVIELRQQAHRAVSAASAKQGLDLRVPQSGQQLAEPPGVLSREVAVALQQAAVVLEAISLLELGDPRFEGLAIEWSRWSYDGDQVARTDRGWFGDWRGHSDDGL